MNGSLANYVYKAWDEALLTPRPTEHTVLLWRSGMSAGLSSRRELRRQPKAIEARLLNRVVRTASGCWEWQGGKSYGGYGKIYANQRIHDTHRLSYSLFCGPIPEGSYVCHSCDNPSCCNPVHLFLGSPKRNQDDMYQKGRSRHLKGADHPKAKLTDHDVIDIRRRSASGETTQSIADSYGIKVTSATGIILGRIWKHLPGACPPKARLKMTRQLAEELKRLNGTGITYRELSEQFGVSKGSIFRAFVRYGIGEVIA